MTADDPVVLVVDDEVSVADLYTAYLADEYDVRTAYSGEDALELLTRDVDVALLDRRLVEWSGDELVTVIKDRQLDCQIALVTAVEPDFDIVDLAIDTYIQKPVTQEDLLDTVEELLLWRHSPKDAQELLALVSRKLVLEQEKSRSELQTSTRYAKLERRIEFAENRLHLRLGDAGSKFRPPKCGRCGMRWDVSVGDTVGFIQLSSYVWKCTQCGNVEKNTDPHDRHIARR